MCDRGEPSRGLTSQAKDNLISQLVEAVESSFGELSSVERVIVKANIERVVENF